MDALVSEVGRTMEEWTDAWLRRDAGAVDSLMGPDYVYVSPLGKVLDRQAIMQIVRSPTYSAAGRRTEVEVRTLGSGAAAVLSRWQGEGSYEGTPFKDDHRCLSVFTRAGNRWQMTLEQCTAVSA